MEELHLGEEEPLFQEQNGKEGKGKSLGKLLNVQKKGPASCLAFSPVVWKFNFDSNFLLPFFFSKVSWTKLILQLKNLN